jgi:hypothetical protein
VPFSNRAAARRPARAGIPADAHEASCRPAEARELTFQGFIDGIWRPHLNRRGVKPSTLKSYESGLKNHIQPKLGDLLLIPMVSLDIGRFSDWGWAVQIAGPYSENSPRSSAQLASLWYRIQARLMPTIPLPNRPLGMTVSQIPCGCDLNTLARALPHAGRTSTRQIIPCG